MVILTNYYNHQICDAAQITELSTTWLDSTTWLKLKLYPLAQYALLLKAMQF